MKHATKNWKTTLAGVALAVLGVLQASHAKSPMQAIQDHNVQLDMVAAAGMVLAKDADKS